jgi:hypothetical protein
MSKYGSKKTTIDGIVFDSKREANRYCELKLLEKAGKIKDLKLQHQFVLQPPFKKNGKTIRAITYVADFVYFDLERMRNVVEDVKGYKTDVYQLKKKMFEYKYPDLTIVEVQ